MMAHNIQDFRAVGDGETSNTAAIQAAIDACAAAGGGTVLIPPGRYVTGAVTMRSDVTLLIESGATLLGSGRTDDFPLWRSNWEGGDRPNAPGQPGR